MKNPVSANGHAPDTPQTHPTDTGAGLGVSCRGLSPVGGGPADTPSAASPLAAVAKGEAPDLLDVTTLAFALGGHDDVTPSDAAHLRNLAADIEAGLIAHEVQFADVQWHDVLRLRALATLLERDALTARVVERRNRAALSILVRRWTDADGTPLPEMPRAVSAIADALLGLPIDPEDLAA